MFLLFRFTLPAIDLLPADRDAFDAFVRQKVDFVVFFTSAPVRDSAGMRTQTFRVPTGEVHAALSVPFAIRRFLEFATNESTSSFHLRRDANPVHMKILALLADGVVPSAC